MKPLPKLAPAIALLLFTVAAKADNYLVSESGVFGAGAPTTAESAPGATFSYSFLMSSMPTINFITNFGGPDCGFDTPFSNFRYTLNGAPVLLSGPDVEFFGSAFGGGAIIAPNAGVNTDNFNLETASFAQFFTGTALDPFGNPTMVPGVYAVDPDFSIFQTDYSFSGGTPISGYLSISQTPEPNSIILLGSGLAGLGGLLRRRRRC